MLGHTHIIALKTKISSPTHLHWSSEERQPISQRNNSDGFGGRVCERNVLENIEPFIAWCLTTRLM